MAARQALAPPAHSRARASSTTLRSGLTLASLGRRRSASCLLPTPAEDSSLPSPLTCDSPSSESSPPSSMFSDLAARVFHWLYIPNHARAWSTPASPRSSTDEPVLPLSASAQKTSFGPEVHEKILSDSRLPFQWRHVLQPVRYPPFFLLLRRLTCILELWASPNCPATVHCIYCTRADLHVHFTYNPRLAADHYGCSSIGQGTPRLLSEWSRPSCACSKRNGHRSYMEACLVYPWQRRLGEYTFCSHH